MALKVFEPTQKNIKHFTTTDEFEKYLIKHKDEFDEWTTQKLNTSFKIDGYRITKIKGEICLKKDYYNYTPQKDKVNEEIIKRIERIEENVNKTNECNEKINDYEFNIKQLNNRLYSL